jgi:hypothetical protein
MKTNKGLKEWLIDENMELEVNDLSEIRLTNVGIFTKCHPHEPLLHVHEYMLKQLIEEKCPELK